MFSSKTGSADIIYKLHSHLT